MKNDYFIKEFYVECPCDSCEHKQQCKEKLLACKQFVHFVNTGRLVYGEKNPTRKIWQKIFIEDALSEEN